MPSNKSVLILGGRGNLGVQLAKVFANSLVWGRDDLDVTDFSLLRVKISEMADQLTLVINCVAYNDVDGAESNQETAHLLNAQLPGQLAKIGRDLNLPLLHYSTGYVFSGRKNFYVESDSPNPISVYGASKAEGEKNIQAQTEKFYIVRTNILFGPPGLSAAAKPSVVDIMKDRGLKEGRLKGVTDEFASFTYTPDLARATFNLVSGQYAYGIYHLTNEGFGSWFNLAQEIFNILQAPIVITPVLAKDFKRKALRPRHSVLQNTKLPRLRTWPEALCDYLKPGLISGLTN